MDLPLAPSYAVLCLLQGLLVLAPGHTWTFARSRVLGLVVLLAATGGGIGIVRAFDSGADDLTALATVATPVLAAASGWARRWPYPWLPLVLVPGLYVLAWQRPVLLVGQAAGLLLIGAACLTLSALIGALAPPRAVAAGLVLAVVVDVVLVWGVHQVGPTTVAVHAAVPPSLRLPGAGHATPLPALQDGTFGSALMGWLDFLAPAVLGTLLTRRLRTRAAAATTAAALAWGLLLYVTDPVAATVPVLAGLMVGRRSLDPVSGLGTFWTPGAQRRPQRRNAPSPRA